LIGSGVIGKTLWLLFFPIFQATRPPRLKEIRFMSRWTVANIAFVALCDVVIFLLIGPAALLYLLASAVFAVGLHPLGARWIQEHYLTDDPQETYSYYGWVNTVALNVGYHNEHHDFPSIPWNRLPKLKRIAPEFYEHLTYHGSWSRLLLRFLFDRELSLFSRMIRADRGGSGVT
jgi:sphingolipid delta-4 desaturase